MNRKPSTVLILTAVAVACCLGQAATVWGQIAGDVEYPRDSPIILTASVETPDGAEVQYLWDSASAEIRQGPSPQIAHIWAGPGEHRVRVDAFWICWDTKQFGVVRHDHIFVVEGSPDPPPDPDPDPPPPGPRKLTILRESGDQTPAMATLLLRLQTMPEINEAGHDLVILDPDSKAPDGKPSPQAVKYKELLAQAGVSGAGLVVEAGEKVLYAGSLPGTVGEVVEMLK